MNASELNALAPGDIIKWESELPRPEFGVIIARVPERFHQFRVFWASSGVREVVGASHPFCKRVA